MSLGKNGVANTFANAGAKLANAVPNFGSGNSRSTTNSGFMGVSTPLLIFMSVLLVLLVVFSYYYDVFMDSIQNWSDSLNAWITGKENSIEPPMSPSQPPSAPVLAPPTPPQDQHAVPPSGMSAIVEKVLPPAKEIFSVSKNDYTYYDAAPLCKALGAELASYEDVKNAWNKGADWCNYGWVKGQTAVYPTQKSSYEELQQGPAEQRNACGKPGVNGGYFDNPELKFGVTCVGKRPSQSQHDATAAMAGGKYPLTASGLEFEKKVQKFKEDSDSMGILPFNKEKWSS